MTTYIQQGSYVPTGLNFVQLSLDELLQFIAKENVAYIMAVNAHESSSYFDMSYHKHEELGEFLLTDCKYSSMSLVYPKDPDGTQPNPTVFTQIDQGVFRVWMEDMEFPFDPMVTPHNIPARSRLVRAMKPISIQWLAARIHQVKPNTYRVHKEKGYIRVALETHFPLAHTEGVKFLESLQPTIIHSIVGELDIIHFMMNATGSFFYSYEKDTYDEGQ